MTIEKLVDFGVLYKEGRNFYPTHAFGLMTDNKNRFAKVQCALFKGVTRDVFIDQKVFDGPIQNQVENGEVNFCKRFTLDMEYINNEIETFKNSTVILC